MRYLPLVVPDPLDCGAGKLVARLELTAIRSNVSCAVLQSNIALRTPAKYVHLVITDSFPCPWGKKAPTVCLNSTRLKRRTDTFCGPHSVRINGVDCICLVGFHLLSMQVKTFARINQTVADHGREDPPQSNTVPSYTDVLKVSSRFSSSRSHVR